MLLWLNHPIRIVSFHKYEEPLIQRYFTIRASIPKDENRNVCETLALCCRRYGIHPQDSTSDSFWVSVTDAAKISESSSVSDSASPRFEESNIDYGKCFKCSHVFSISFRMEYKSFRHIQMFTRKCMYVGVNQD